MTVGGTTMNLEQWQLISDIERLMWHVGLSVEQKKIIYDKLTESLANLVPVKTFLLKKFLLKMQEKEQSPTT
tara:strand:+ start:190 stop:405 length:216 start_codon:yes stop_codon:yes gene_type:complete